MHLNLTQQYATNGPIQSKLNLIFAELLWKTSFRDKVSMVMYLLLIFFYLLFLHRWICLYGSIESRPWLFSTQYTVSKKPDTLKFKLA